MPRFETVMSDPKIERGSGKHVDIEDLALIERAKKIQFPAIGGVDVAKVKSAASQAGGRSYEEGFGKREPVVLTNPGEPIDAAGLTGGVDEHWLKSRSRGTLGEQVEAVSRQETEYVQKSDLGQPETVKPTVGKGGERTPERLARLRQELEQARKNLKAAEKVRQEAIAQHNLKMTSQAERDRLGAMATDLYEKKIPNLEILCEELKTEITVVASELKRRGMRV